MRALPARKNGSTSGGDTSRPGIGRGRFAAGGCGGGFIFGFVIPGNPLADALGQLPDAPCLRTISAAAALAASSAAFSAVSRSPASITTRISSSDCSSIWRRSVVFFSRASLASTGLTGIVVPLQNHQRYVCPDTLRRGSTAMIAHPVTGFSPICGKLPREMPAAHPASWPGKERYGWSAGYRPARSGGRTRDLCR